MSRTSRVGAFLVWALAFSGPAAAQMGGLLVSVTSPAQGDIVGATVTVRASVTVPASTAGVQFQLDGVNLDAEDTEVPYEVAWDTLTTGNGSHTLRAVARDMLGLRYVSDPVGVFVQNGSDSGDVYVGLTNGKVMWHAPDGTLKRTLTGVSDGAAGSGLAFDANRILYVPHWYSQTPNAPPGNTLSRFDAGGNLLGSFGSYDCNPTSVAFDATGNVYVGQTDCTGDIRKFDPAGNLLASFDAATGGRGADHIDLGPDGCTVFYATWTHDVLRYDVCTGQQLPTFNQQPLPGDQALHLRILPDGGVLVADSQVVVRLDSEGNQVATYSVPDESNWWVGLAPADAFSFWALNAPTAKVYKFDLASGAVQSVFSTGTGPWTVEGVAVKP